MCCPIKNRTWTFFLTFILVLSMALIFSASKASACGGCGGKGSHQHTSGEADQPGSGEKACPMHSKGTAGTAQATSLNDFGKTKLYTCPMHPEVRAKKSGKCPQCGMKLEKAEFYKVYTCSHEGCPSVSAKSGKCCGKGMQMKAMTKQEYYDYAHLQEEFFCPMHSDVVSDQAGKCPKCGMDLEKRTATKVEEKTETM